MIKQEMELSQAFNELELEVKKLAVAYTVVAKLPAQPHSFWRSYVEPIDKKLAAFKTIFYNIMLEKEES